MVASRSKPATVAEPISNRPRLESGDRMDEAEFDRRYALRPDIHKAELIEGVVYVSSPVTLEHGRPHGHLTAWVGFYRAFTPLVEFVVDGTVRLGRRNRPQPDVFLYIPPDRGGQARIGEDRYFVGAPEFAGEVAYSSVSVDLHAKLNSYRKHGVREYLIWRVDDEEIDWFQRVNGRFVPLTKTRDGLLKSQVFPGLWLDPDALLARDLGRVLEVVQRGVAGAEHARFLRGLEQARPGGG